MRLPIDITLEKIKTNSHTAAEYFEKLQKQLEIIKKVTNENLDKYQEKYTSYHNKKSEDPEFTLGQQVWLHKTHVPQGQCKKFQDKYVGPYYITDIGPNHSYKIKDGKTHKQMKSFVHANRLKTYNDPEQRPEHLQEDEVQKQPLIPNQEEEQPQTTDQTQQQQQLVDQERAQQNTDTTETHEYGIVDKLLRCSKYRGRKLYQIKWKNHRKTTWEPEENIPSFLIREFHVNRTQKGKIRKRNR